MPDSIKLSSATSFVINIYNTQTILAAIILSLILTDHLIPSSFNVKDVQYEVNEYGKHTLQNTFQKKTYKRIVNNFEQKQKNKHTTYLETPTIGIFNIFYGLINSVMHSNNSPSKFISGSLSLPKQQDH